MARYIERGPLSLEKLSVTDEIVSYSTRDGRTHEFDALEFLALLSCHIPKPYESITRYYGWYSCRARGERAKRKQTDTSSDLPETKAAPSTTWAACMKRIFEINPTARFKAHPVGNTLRRVAPHPLLALGLFTAARAAPPRVRP